MDQVYFGSSVFPDNTCRVLLRSGQKHAVWEVSPMTVNNYDLPGLHPIIFHIAHLFPFKPAFIVLTYALIGVLRTLYLRISLWYHVMILAKTSDLKIAELFPFHINTSASVLVSALFYQQLKGSECSLYLISQLLSSFSLAPLIDKLTRLREASSSCASALVWFASSADSALFYQQLKCSACAVLPI